MDKQISMTIFLIFLLLISSHFKLAKCVNAASICNKTPHPELCHSLRIGSTFVQNENGVVLRDLSLRATLAQAANAHNLISEMEVSSFEELGRSAWSDCLELHRDSIYQLNRSVAASNADVQTWLSAAIANQDTCPNGFLDFNLSSTTHLESFQLLLNDFSRSLTNSLAINKAVAEEYSHQDSSKQELRNRNRFPDWVSAGDRRLLRSSGRHMKADIVVARDGSGDYTTISAALAAAKRRRRGSKRFVIYVKKGVYNENVEIKKSMKNLMFVGDGIDATVVTGNRNVLDD